MDEDLLISELEKNRTTSPVFKIKVKSPEEIKASELSKQVKKDYIGGNSNEARNKFWSQDAVLNHAVDSIASRYNIPSNALRYRLNHEGFVDNVIKRRNISKSNNDLFLNNNLGYNLLHSKEYNGALHFGLDDVGSMILDGKVKLINENWGSGEFVNEKGRTTNTASGDSVSDNIGITAATLKYFADTIRQKYPNLSDYDVYRYANAYYNRGNTGGDKWVSNGASGYSYKLGGKMNIIEKFKKGRKIHIKKANRGKFTDYCGGKVTSECIAKGKNSSDPAVRKRATFAANARKWKHNFGGLLKAEEGTKFDWGGLAKSVGSNIMSIVSSNKKANAYQEEMNSNLELSYQQALLNLLNKAQELKNSAFNLWMLQYQSGLTQDNPSLIVLAHLFNPDVSLLKNDYNNKKAMNKFKIQQYKNDLFAENISDIGNTIAGSISNYYANKNINPTVTPTGSVDTTFTKIKTPKITYNSNVMNLSLPKPMNI